MDYIVYIRSDESRDYFSQNTASKFRIHLKQPLFLKGFWMVALVEFYCSESIKVSRKRDNVLYLFCDICKESVIDGEKKPILRRIPPSKKNQWMHLFASPFYLPVRKQEIYEMEFYIETQAGELASFLTEPLMITLRFKSYPFYLDNESF